VSDAAPAPAPSTPGAKLRSAREARGWAAAHAAELMRLPVGVVEALEGDRYADLGAPVFARGHLRRYALLLELPVEPLLDAYDRSHAGPALPSLIPQASAHTPVREEGDRLRVPVAAWYAVGLAVIAAAAAAGWWWWSQRPAAEAAPEAAPPPAAGTESP
jgi:cytoskeleton protein RodZ